MNKTNVDEMLLQMIAPKVRDIQEKFSRGEGLTSEDVNTLLLKSQYNHINHLDEKLNEVTVDVSSIKQEIKLLEVSLNAKLDENISAMRADVNSLKHDFNLLDVSVSSKFDAFEKNFDFKIQKAINSNMRWSLGLIAIVVMFIKLLDVLAAKLPNLF
ncbi:MAG: hypothetical protein ACKVOU_02940 [Cytophagales bacterium]